MQWLEAWIVPSHRMIKKASCTRILHAGSVQRRIVDP
jgi:hypothetical protein